MAKKTRNIKRKKHDQIINDYDKIKSKHLEKLANKMLKDEEKNSLLKSKVIKGNFLDKF
jgi:AAA+ superfamily predicted ATPase